MNRSEGRLSARDLSVSRGGRSIFTKINFAVASSELLAVTGANGAGKSTLLRASAGLHPLAGGTLRFDETKNSDATIVHRKSVV